MITAIPMITLSCRSVVELTPPNFPNKNLIQNTITGEGSSSVLPILRDIESIADGFFQYQSTGSGAGFNSMNKEKSKYDFAMTSSTKIPNNKWANNGTRTITWAFDAIGIIVNLPKDYKTINNSAPILSSDLLLKAYAGEKIYWNDLVINLLPNKSHKIVRAYGRIGGSSKSGTADGFMHTLLSFQNTYSKEMIAKIKDHDTLDVENLSLEANSAAFSKIQDKEGTIGYVSLGYAVNNVNDKVKLANIKVNKNIWIPSIDNVKNGSYKWTRPFNIIYDSKNSKSVELAKYLMSNKMQEYILNKGFVSLSKEQIDIQNNFELSDQELFNIVANKSSFVEFNRALYGLRGNNGK